MKFYYIVIFIFFVLGVIDYIVDKENQDKGKFKRIKRAVGEGVFCSFVGAFICFVVFFVGSIVFSIFAKSEDVKYFEKPIYSLQDNMATNGRFSMGRGYVNSSLAYYFMAETKYGYKVEYVNSNSAYIQRDGKQKIDFYEKRFENDILEYLFDYVKEGSQFYILHVPQDAIEFDYRIDLQ